MFQKGYLPGWTEEVFSVHGISTTRTVVTYILTEWNGTPIKGTFYEQDVQKVVLPDEALLFRWKKCSNEKEIKCLLRGKGGPKSITVGFGKKTCKYHE